MKGGRAAGLICAGGVGQSFVARFPALLASVSLVKATSFRVARRIANSLRAGRAVEHYAELAQVDLIWIAVPDAALESMIRDLAAEIDGKEKRIVLCDTARDSLWPDSLQKAGARIASINAIGPNDEMLIAEGHPHALREVRRFAAADHRKVIEIRPGSKRLFLAGVHLATHIALPGIAAAVESLRVAGFSRAEATRLVEGARRAHAAGLCQSRTEGVEPGGRPGVAARPRRGARDALRRCANRRFVPGGNRARVTVLR